MSLFGGSKRKYGIEFMKRGDKGHLRFANRHYFDLNDPDDLEGFNEYREKGLLGLRNELEDSVEDELGPGEYLVLMFTEKRKKNGAIKSKKTLDRITIQV